MGLQHRNDAVVLTDHVDLTRARHLHFEGLIGGRVHSLGRKVLEMHPLVPPARRPGAVGDEIDKATRPTHIQMRVGRLCRQHGGQVERLPGITIVVMQVYASGKRGVGDAPTKRHALGRACAIVHLELATAVSQAFGHAQDRRHTDATCQQQRALTRYQRKVIARRADPNRLAFLQLRMHCHRATARFRVAQHADDVAMLFAGVIAQRILTHQPGADFHIDMGTCAEPRQVTIEGFQFQRDDIQRLCTFAGQAYVEISRVHHWMLLFLVLGIQLAVASRVRMSARKRSLRIFPEAVRGKSSTMIKRSGYFCRATPTPLTCSIKASRLKSWPWCRIT
ncbi:hypothetical protein D3C76_782180 [compost metagenome]